MQDPDGRKVLEIKPDCWTKLRFIETMELNFRLILVSFLNPGKDFVTILGTLMILKGI